MKVLSKYLLKALKPALKLEMLQKTWKKSTQTSFPQLLIPILAQIWYEYFEILIYLYNQKIFYRKISFMTCQDFANSIQLNAFLWR